MSIKQVTPYEALWQDWTNNFGTLNCFASYYHMSIKTACKVINKGRILHETNLGNITDIVTKRRSK